MRAMMVDRPDTARDVPEDVLEEAGCPACWFVREHVRSPEDGDECLSFVQIDDGRVVQVTELEMGFMCAMVCEPTTLAKAREKIAVGAAN